MNAEIKTIIDQIRKEDELYKFPPFSSLKEEFVEKFKNKFLKTFKCSVDTQYLEFLKESDGIECNGQCIYSSSFSDNKRRNFDIFSNYLIWQSYDEFRDYVVIGDSELDIYIYTKVNNKFEVRDSGGTALWESYDSFDLLCLNVLRKMIN
jgi:CRISPR/Cas system CMR-associated protein Cmr1 (group 7 of RAMP superfamily)